MKCSSINFNYWIETNGPVNLPIVCAISCVTLLAKAKNVIRFNQHNQNLINNLKRIQPLFVDSKSPTSLEMSATSTV